MNQPEPFNPTHIRRIVSLIDLTDLTDDCNQTSIETLCSHSVTPVGHVAAICIWPDFVAVAGNCFDNNSSIQIATVVNFPSGNEPLSKVCATIEKALDEGATEIDYVLPYSALINGNTDDVIKSLKTVRDHIPADSLLKVILETGVLHTSDLIRAAAEIAIDQGADFIKTSTGKVSINATPEAAAIMLDTIADRNRNVGFKAAGGIKTVEDAFNYLKLSDERFGEDWTNPTHFRFGASSLLQDALAKTNAHDISFGDTYNY